ncbi:MAG: SUMF1/EgtB/PvdO family nonheme iron enzyme [Planctomycetes bacterium]|nr:SUMF1/EgtB/PvdO family nonheme iron enzyme [Planctomycetota bacterium]
MTNSVDRPVPPRLWPMVAMGLLSGLLATFLAMQWIRSEPEEPAAAPLPVSAPVAAPPPEIPKRDEAAELLDQARQAVAADRLEEAEAHIAKAKAVRDAPEADELEAEIRRRKDAAEEERRAREAADRKAREELELAEAELARVRQEVAKLQDEGRYAAAVARCDRAAKEFPQTASIDEYTNLREKAVRFLAEVTREYEGKLEEARRESEQNRWGTAAALVRKAMNLWPEGEKAAALLKEITRGMLTANMIRVPASPAGGVSLGDPDRADEPVRHYTGGAFLIDRHEVTNEEFAMFVKETGRRPPPSMFWKGNDVLSGYGRLPVTHVSAADAEAFAAWAGKRLPSEDEWEYAARWLDRRIYPWGDAFPEGDSIAANTLETSLGELPRVKPVESYPNGQSPFGVYDLAGNVWEWTSTELGEFRILKGGSFLTNKGACRASNRFADEAGLAHPDVGFRCVKDVAP